MSRDQTPNHGGGNRWIVGDVSKPDVQHEVDLCLAQAAQDFMRRVVVAKRMNGEVGYARIKATGMWRFTKELCRDLSRKPHLILYPGARNALRRILGEEKAASVEAIALERSQTKVIGPGPLPLKPPQKPREPDDE